MSIGSVNYPAPVMVDGYSCNNCSDVSLATKGIDPHHPKSGPNNRDAAGDATRTDFDPVKLAAARRHPEPTAASTAAGYSATGAPTQPAAAGPAVSVIL